MQKKYNERYKHLLKYLNPSTAVQLVHHSTNRKRKRISIGAGKNTNNDRKGIQGWEILQLLPRDKRQGAEMVITINLLMNISEYLKSLVQMAKD